jgi:hypothetical protein
MPGAIAVQADSDTTTPIANKLLRMMNCLP